MPINTKTTRIEAVFPAAADGGKRCSSVIDRELPDFRSDSGLFCPKTAMFAAALAMSACDEAMLRENLTQTGYKDQVFLSFEGAQEDKTGVALAIKDDGGAPAVIAVLRPTVGREWFSNFDIGYGTEHMGFLKAAEYAEQRLSDYLFVRRPQQSPRFLVTGYSRGGAVANILAKRLCDRYGTDMVRGYTFAAPNTCVTVKGARYSSIFNLVRDEDFFTRIPLSGWGYTKYGSTLSLSDCGDIRNRYRILSGEDYIGFSSSSVVERFLCHVIQIAPNVHAFYERRYPVGEREMSLNDYMMMIARMLAGEADENTGELMLDTSISAFGGLTEFLISGMDVGALFAPIEELPRCSVADSHSPAAYMAALDAFLR